MPGPSFPLPTGEVIATLVELFRHQNQPEIVELLEAAHARFEEGEYDNWNGGTQYWALQLELPVAKFAAAQGRLDSIEKKVLAMLRHLSPRFPSDPVSSVVFLPITVGQQPLGQRMAPSELEVRRLWGDDRFRLFVSHVSKHKLFAAALKDALWIRGIHAFVAHEDIEPSREWQDEIELALRSMHALAAVLTEDFHLSDWTDQEVGWALGRGVLVLPLRVDRIPYGLVQKTQALPGNLSQPKRLAAKIAQTLLANPQTRGEMRRAVVRAVELASSTEEALALSPLVSCVSDANDDEKRRLWQACTSSTHIAGAEGVAEAIHGAIGPPPVPQRQRVLSEDDIPF